MNSMSNSLKAWGIYLMLVPGIGLMAVPEFMLDLFQFSHGEDMWMARLIGMFTFILGVLDYAIGVYEHRPMAKLTVVLRYGAAVFMAGLWATGQLAILILLFAAIDVLGATWTMLTLKNPGSDIAPTA